MFREKLLGYWKGTGCRDQFQILKWLWAGKPNLGEKMKRTEVVAMNRSVEVWGAR